MKDFRHEIAAEYQDLFDFMKQEHGLILTVEQMNEIIYEVRKFEDSFDDKLGREISEMSNEVAGQSERLVCGFCGTEDGKHGWTDNGEVCPLDRTA